MQTTTGAEGRRPGDGAARQCAPRKRRIVERPVSHHRRKGRDGFRRRAKRAGIEGPVNTHGWRHTFGRLYLLDGGDLATLSRLMGHSNVGVTAEFYAVYSFQELKRKHDEHSPVAHMFDGGGDAQGEN